MEGDGLVLVPLVVHGISIHTLRMEGDHWLLGGDVGGYDISIHTLRLEGDGMPASGAANGKYFNPHPPHGG